MNDLTVTMPPVNRANQLAARAGLSALAPLARRSFAEVHEQFKDRLSFTESIHLYRAAKAEWKENRLYEAKLLTRASPLARALAHLGIAYDSSALLGYEEEFGGRADKFVRPGTVSSMFSPAAYLTELYREAQDLLPSSIHHINSRRNDIRNLVLNQENMDRELRAVEISNEVLAAICQSKLPADAKDLWQYLATYVRSGSLPFCLPFAAVREAYLQKDPGWNLPLAAPDVHALLQSTADAIALGLSSEERRIVTEAISDDRVDVMYEQYFGTMDPAQLLTVAGLAHYYDIDAALAEQFVLRHAADIDVSLTMVEGQSLIVEGIIELQEWSVYPLDGSGSRFGATFKVKSLQTTDRWGCYILANKYQYLAAESRNEDFHPGMVLTFNLELNHALLLSLPEESHVDLLSGSGGEWKMVLKKTRKDLKRSLLTINRQIRLLKATSTSYAIASAAVDGLQELDKPIAWQSLERLLHVKQYIDRYALTSDEAAVLSGAAIPTTTIAGERSAFDRLFNDPPLNGNVFTPDGSTLDLSAVEYDIRRETLKRGFEVDDLELLDALRAFRGDAGATEVELTLANISGLYRAVLQARVHGLTQAELRLLQDITAAGRPGLREMDRVYDAVRWVEEHKLTVYDLWTLTIAPLSQEATSAVLNFIQALRQVDVGEDPDRDTLVTALSQPVAATFQIADVRLASAALRWAHDLKPGGLDLVQFWKAIDDWTASGDPTELLEPSAEVVMFCHGLAQRTIVAKSLGIAPAVLQLFVTEPTRFDPVATHLAGEWSTLRELTAFQEWFRSLGDRAEALFLALAAGTLDVVALANAMHEVPTRVEQAAGESFSHGLTRSVTACDSWRSISAIVQWLRASATLNVAPRTISDLILLGHRDGDTLFDCRFLRQELEPTEAENVNEAAQPNQAIFKHLRIYRAMEDGKLKADLGLRILFPSATHTVALWYRQNGDHTIVRQSVSNAVGDVLVTFTFPDTFDTSLLDDGFVLRTQHYADRPSDFGSYAIARKDNWATWQSVANAMEAALDAQEAKSVGDVLEPAKSAALSAFLVQALPNVSNREELFQYLFLDNLNGPEVKASRIGEAIASLQLYVHRALNGLEPGVNAAVTSRPFFANWDLQNSRYSTWAASAKLAYYPENYVDPTVRHGQTGLMNEMLQQLGQAQLNTDTVGDAFHAYLSGFEEVANLKVTSGYHDHTDIRSGKTYFIGENQADPREYYWRSVDEYKRGATGILPANAWTDWRKIGCAPIPWGNAIRPVVFKSRLYVCWIERKDVTPPKSDGSPGTPKQYEFRFKLSYQRYDGNWSTPLGFPIAASLQGYDKDGNGPGLYCSSDAHSQNVFIIVYEKTASHDITPTNSYGIELSEHFDHRELSEARRKHILESTRSELDFNNVAEKGINNRFIDRNGSYYIEQKLQNVVENDSLYLSVRGPTIFDATVKAVHGHAVTIEFPNLKMHVNQRTLPWEQRRVTIALTEHLGENVSAVAQLWRTERNAGIKTVDAVVTTDSIYVFRDREDSHVVNFSYYPKDSPWSVDLNGLVWQKDYENYIVFKFPRPLDYEKMSAASVKFEQSWARFQASGIQFFIGDPFDYLVLAVGGHVFPLKDYISGSRPGFSFDGTIYPLRPISAEIQTEGAQETQVVMHYYCGISGYGVTGMWGDVALRRVPAPATLSAQIGTTSEQAQYYKVSEYYTRLNTLFARQLVERATVGIDSILSYETQKIQEPALPGIAIVGIRLQTTPETRNGMISDVRVYCRRHDDKEYYLAWQRAQPSCAATFAVSWDDASREIELSFVIGATDPVDGEKLSLVFEETSARSVSYRIDGGMPSLVKDVQLLVNENEEMDFNGANALYFWELFFYTPMMVAQRMLQEQRFEEAERWLKYVWNPAGYVLNGQRTERKWNVRPLQEDTSWNDDPLESSDPDAVAQYDPMHYKVATIMRALDLLIARGDAAYRRQDRDSMVEAKMWYGQALTLLGDRPYIEIDQRWPEPPLFDAMASNRTDGHMAALTRLRTGEVLPQGEERAASKLFLPEANDFLLSYWETLALRMFNLRHGLSIDGQAMNLPLFAKPSDPKALLHAAVAASSGASQLPTVTFTPQWRFPIMVDSARGMVAQLIQFGQSMQAAIERQDAEALNEMMQAQAAELMVSTLRVQEQTIVEIEAERETVQCALEAAQVRQKHFSKLYEENISARERSALDSITASQTISAGAKGLHMAAAAAGLAPNVFGLANGGMKWEGPLNAAGIGISLAADATAIAGHRIVQEEAWRRRREEWEILRKNAEGEIRQFEAQLGALDVRVESARMQRAHLEMQQAQTHAQLAFLRTKFTSQALYSWLRGRLATVLFQFYDLAASRCLMAEKAWQWETGRPDRFIKPGHWQGTWAGLTCGEMLMSDLARMEDAYLRQDTRSMEVRRTVSLAQVYAGLGEDAFSLKDAAKQLVNEKATSFGTELNGMVLTASTAKELAAKVDLAGLKLGQDYPNRTGRRRIKRISVSLPAVLGAYQDVQAELSYSGPETIALPKGCNAIAVSHGMQDDGMFRLDFADGKLLPFEGLDAQQGGLTLQFTNATTRQKSILESLNDVILHIDYIIRPES